MKRAAQLQVELEIDYESGEKFVGLKRNNGKVQINMKIISITGGVGSGKSEVLRVLQEEFDAEIIKADEVAHQLMEPGKKGYQHV